MKQDLPFKLIDLTHTLSPKVPSWNGSCGFEPEIKMDYSDSTGDVKFRVHQIKMHAGIGTHMDAPAHCIPGGKSISDIDINELAAPCVVIDVSSHAHERYSLTPSDIQAFEEKHGKVPERAFVIVYSGWDRFWSDPEKYRNNHVFPSISKEAAEILLARNIVGLGIDTLSPDRSEDGFPVHQLMLGAGKYIVENVANAKSLTPIGSYSLALPIKAQDCTETPMRLAALLSQA